jgi:hypothetical protein
MIGEFIWQRKKKKDFLKDCSQDLRKQEIA